MRLELTKIHGCQNDYLFVDCTAAPLEAASEIARRLSDRRCGVGSDGLICVRPSDQADFRMEMYNADGSRGEMCGNGIRGLGKFVYERGLTAASRDSITVETDAGIKQLDLHKSNGKVHSVTVGMGEAVLDGKLIPINHAGRFLDQRIEAAGREWKATCVSMGNPHCVTFDLDPDTVELDRVGPAFENHELFPKRVNAEFVSVESPERLRMRVWERGSGETMACGTGACAAVVAGVLTHRCGRRAVVVVRGGELEIDYRDDGTVVMTGPAVEAYRGSVEVAI
jgi:diaminopimelate epimerase